MPVKMLTTPRRSSKVSTPNENLALKLAAKKKALIIAKKRLGSAQRVVELAREIRALRAELENDGRVTVVARQSRTGLFK